MRMARAEMKEEAQDIEGAIDLQVEQDKEQSLFQGIEDTLEARIRKAFYSALLTALLLDFLIGYVEHFKQPQKTGLRDSDEGFYSALVFEFLEFLVHGLIHTEDRYQGL